MFVELKCKDQGRLSYLFLAQVVPFQKLGGYFDMLNLSKLGGLRNPEIVEI
jgi:hypothetical protein